MASNLFTMMVMVLRLSVVHYLLCTHQSGLFGFNIIKPIVSKAHFKVCFVYSQTLTCFSVALELLAIKHRKRVSQCAAIENQRLRILLYNAMTECWPSRTRWMQQDVTA